MKKIILVLLCMVYCIMLSHGQDKQIDSLLKVLETSKEDTAKVKTLNRLAYFFMNNDPDTAIYFAKQAQELAKTLNDESGIADAYFITGVADVNLGNYDKALKFSSDAVSIYDRLLNKSSGASKTEGKSVFIINKAKACLTKGRIYNSQGNYSEALKYILESLKISEEISDKNGIANAYNYIGIVYDDQGNYTEALKNYFASMKMCEETGYQIGIANAFTNIGTIYNNQGNYPEALKNYNAALKIYTEIGRKTGIALIYNTIGTIYQAQGNYGEALKNYHACLQIRIEIGDKQGMADSYNNIGTIYNAQGNYAEALKNQYASLKLKEEIGDKSGIAVSCGNLGIVNTNLKNYIEAKMYFDKAIVLSKETGNKYNLKRTYRNLAILDSARGNYKDAFNDYKLYALYSDSLVNDENVKETTQLQMQYEFDKKEELAKHEQEEKDALALKELQRQKLIRDFALGTIGLVLVLFFFIYRSYRARQALRLNDIRNRIAGDLHDDIGSTLNSISIYSEVARKKDENYDEALEMIGDASRKIIEAMSDIVWTINAENDSFEKIIFRMKSLAYNLFRAIKIEFTFHSDEILNEKKLSLEERRNFYLIFKEAINNMVKYSKATRAAITLTYENNRIRLRIQDNGVGFDTSKENAGNGLKNMKRRADEMKAGFIIESQPGSGTKIELILKV